MRNTAVQPEAQTHHLYPPIFISMLDFFMFPAVIVLHMFLGATSPRRKEDLAA
jgi:hypothetical protein